METSIDPENDLDANSLKEKGNECVKNGNFKEAILLYTHAIKIEPNNDLLHSNRSLTYLRLKQYALALQDANETIRLNPSWAKGYFRKAEVEAAVGLLDEAYESYETARQLLPNDTNIMEAMIRVSIAQKKEAEARDRLPWVFSCVGLIIGVVFTILDYTVAEEPTLTNPFLQVAFTMTVAGCGWLASYAYLTLKEQQNSKTLELHKEEDNVIEENQIPEKIGNKYTKAQARHRYKKGKLL
ncbi:uncharacterized protein LOC143910621 [Arctopsyche grandis]|uniref:uncharacterized protein LOC143910621 n=1 Tax=Arctopsyche grandis TaxID=121162 RepID=UPI00406D9B45